MVFAGIAGYFGGMSFVDPSTDSPQQPQPVASPSSPVQPVDLPPSTSDTSLASSHRSARTSPSQSTIARIITPQADDAHFITETGETYPLRTYQALLTPNDPLPSQWWTTQTSLAPAWNYGTAGSGSYTPAIAIIDSGFALAHEEFAGRWHQSDGEQGATTLQAPSQLNCTDRNLALDQSCNNIDDDFDGIVDNESGTTSIENPSWLNCTDRSLALDKSCNRIDDDNNGFIDDVTGWDFSNYDHSVQTGETNPAGEGTLHGTLVTGALGATGNNSVGIAGVNWSATLLPLQALDDDGYGNTLTVARAIYYAADQNVDIINISLGASAEDPYLRQAIAYALDRDIIVVAASGNDGCDCITYPARYPEVLAVGAFGESLSPSTFSNYGAELDLLAPGENFTLPAWSASNSTTGYLGGAAGTSFAAPYVSGLLGLIKSHQPTASWGELVAALLETSDRRSLTGASPHSTTFGYGYVRADTPLARVTTPATPGMRYTFGPVMPTDTLDSFRVHQCDAYAPATLLYELTSGNIVRYTASKLTLHRAQQTGWTKTRAFPVCVGLSHDQPSSVRTINLLSELHNNAPNKWSP